MKWLGLILMTLDHINKYLFDAKFPGLFAAGRMCVPIFGFVLAYNLARSGAMQRDMHLRVMERLMIAGLIATPFYIEVGHLSPCWWPLNIMFMLLVATGMIYLIEKGNPASLAGATALFIFGGMVVEYWWFALSFCLTAWWYCKSPNAWSMTGLVGTTASLFLINGNLWALAALPVILIAPYFDLSVPRFRYLFYAYYPAHLGVILTLKLFLKV